MSSLSTSVAVTVMSCLQGWTPVDVVIARGVRMSREQSARRRGALQGAPAAFGRGARVPAMRPVKSSLAGWSAGSEQSCISRLGAKGAVLVGELVGRRRNEGDLGVTARR